MNSILTPLELKVMKELWALKKAFVKDVVENWKEDPVPAYNTVSTTIRILEDKGMVDHESIGRSHLYFPVLSKVSYQQKLLKNVIREAFSGSVNSMVSTLIDNEKLEIDDINNLKDFIDQSEWSLT